MTVQSNLAHPGRPMGLDPVIYCVFAKELPKKHGASCGQCAAIQHALIDAADKAAEIVRSEGRILYATRIETAEAIEKAARRRE